MRVGAATLTVASVAAFLATTTSTATEPVTAPKPTTSFFNQTLDHFNASDARKWQQRYLSYDVHWDGSGRLPNGCKGPVLLYTGNEGDIEGFWESNGFMQDVLAPKLGAFLLFPEERYYGMSLPFGRETFAPQNAAENAKYLSTRQVLADYAEIVKAVKASHEGMRNCPVVAFGGSYGGTLTTFLRLTYPDVVVGGLAASAPVGYYDPENWEKHGVDAFTWAGIISDVYGTTEHPECLERIESTRVALNDAAAEDLKVAFSLCEAKGLGPTSHADLFLYALESLPQLDYPAKEFPVNKTCRILAAADAHNASSLIEAAAAITASSLGGSPGRCLATLPEGPGQVPGDGPGGLTAWSFQSCSETLHLFSSATEARNPKAGGIRDYTFDLGAQKALCSRLWGGQVPDPHHLAHEFGGYAISRKPGLISNVIWSNGGLDPWHGGGFYPGNKPGAAGMCVQGEEGVANVDEERDCDAALHVEAGNGVHYIWIRRGAHHGDLRAPTSEDPEELTAARALEAEIIEGWIKDYAEEGVEKGKEEDEDVPCYKILHSDQCWARKDCEWGRYGCVQRP